MKKSNAVVGTKVLIKKSSKYYVNGGVANPKDTVGVITCLSHGRVLPINVAWESGCTNAYSLEDLKLAEPKVSTVPAVVGVPTTLRFKVGDVIQHDDKRVGTVLYVDAVIGHYAIKLHNSTSGYGLPSAPQEVQEELDHAKQGWLASDSNLSWQLYKPVHKYKAGDVVRFVREPSYGAVGVLGENVIIKRTSVCLAGKLEYSVTYPTRVRLSSYEQIIHEDDVEFVHSGD